MFKKMLKAIQERKAKRVKVLITNLENKVEELIEKIEQLDFNVDENYGKINNLEDRLQEHCDSSTDDSDIIDRIDTIEYDLDGKASQDDFDDLDYNFDILGREVNDLSERVDDTERRLDELENLEKVEERVKAIETRQTTIKDFKVAMLSFFAKLDTTKKQKKTFNKLVEMLDNLE